MSAALATYAYFVDGLVRQSEPKTILEIGLGEAATTADIILQSIPRWGGKYIAMDMAPTEYAIKLLNKYPTENWELRICDSQNEKNLIQFDCGTSIDLLLIDGAHNENNCYSDTTRGLIISNLNFQHGIVVWHDIFFNRVRYAINKVATEFNLDVFYFANMNLAVGKYKL